MAVRTSTKSFLQDHREPCSAPQPSSFKIKNCKHSYVKFPPPGWTGQGKGEGEGGQEEGKGRAGEGRGEVSVAWPDQGRNWEKEGEEILPVCICTGLVSGMVLAQPQLPPTHLPIHLSICLRCLGMLVRGYQGGETPGAGPQELRSEQYLGVRI